jgi:hypothetical protein
MSLPNFLVIGAYRSGTTTLHDALGAHREIFVPKRKEPSFFAFDGVSPTSSPTYRRSITSLEEYERLFEAAGDENAVGEVSPEYLANPTACPRIKARVPGARLVAVLRNPIERAHSDFLMYVGDGREPDADFGRALGEQEERYRAGLPTGYYVRTGFYGRQLRPFFEAFPQKQIQIHLFDDFARDPVGVLRAVFAFLRVQPGLGPEMVERRNVSGVPRNAAMRALMRVAGRVAPAVPRPLRRPAKALLARGLKRPGLRPEHRRQLAEIYRDDLRELELLLGRSLEHWLRD